MRFTQQLPDYFHRENAVMTNGGTKIFHDTQPSQRKAADESHLRRRHTDSHYAYTPIERRFEVRPDTESRTFSQKAARKYGTADNRPAYGKGNDIRK